MTTFTTTFTFNSSANIVVTNNTGGTARITLCHQYTGGPVESKTWCVAANQITAPPLVVHYNTGFLRTGRDSWWIGVQVMDGPHAGKSFASDGSCDEPGKVCTLGSDDNGRTLVFSVSTSTFLLQELSGSCSTSMRELSAEQIANAKREQP